MSALPKVHEPHIVSFVCTHGIGKQTVGQTASEVAAVVAQAAAYLGGDYVDSPSQAVGPGSALQALVRIPGSDEFVAQFHDAYWDELVEPPRPAVVALWMLRVAPLVLWNVAAMWAFDLDSIVSDLPEGSVRRLILPFVGIGAVLLAAPFLLIAGLIIVPASFLPLTICRRARAAFTAVIGDAWLYRSEQLDDSAIAHLRTVVAEAADCSDTVILVGHSQGAELSRRVALDQAVGACVWVGSGEMPLGVLRTLRRSRWLPAALAIVMLAVPGLVAVTVSSGWRAVRSMLRTTFTEIHGLASQAASGPGTGSQRAPGVNFDGLWDLTLVDLVVSMSAIAALLLAALAVKRLTNNPDDMGEQPDCEVLLVKSLLDPVCLGPIDGAFVRFVPTARPWWREHVSYFRKPQTGIAILEAWLGTQAIPTPPHRIRVPPAVYVLAALASALVMTGMWALGEWMLSLVGMS